MKNFIARLFLSIFSLFPAQAEKNFSFTQSPLAIRRYPVSARSFDEAVRQCQQKGPFVKQEGMRYPGLTTYAYRYRCRFNEEGLSELSIVWDQSIFLPSLDEAGLSQADRRAWHNWFNSLAEHERTHARLSSAPWIERRFRGLFGRCRALHLPRERLVASLRQGIDEIKRSVDRDYEELDRLTDHGSFPERYPRKGEK